MDKSAGRCIGAALKLHYNGNCRPYRYLPGRFEGNICAIDNKCPHQIRKYS